MKTLKYTRPHRLSQLHDELLSAVPALRPTSEGVPVMRVEGRGDDIWLTVPDGSDEQAIGAVVNAHVPRSATDPLASKRLRLVELKAKGWPNLTAAERSEAQQLIFEITP